MMVLKREIIVISVFGTDVASAASDSNEMNADIY